MSAQTMRSRQFTAIIEREDDGFVALCPELDVASQGETIEEARRNLREAVELFLETADPSEVEERLHSEVYVTHFALAVDEGLRPKRVVPPQLGWSSHSSS